MNYYNFYCPSDDAYKYLGNTSYVGVWADSEEEAEKICASYVPAPIIIIDKVPDCARISYLY